MKRVRHSLIVSAALAIGISGGECLAQMKAKFYCRAQDSKLALANSDQVVNESRPGFELSRISSEIINRFRQAWVITGNGIKGVEVVVLILRDKSVSYKTILLPLTNQYRKFTFAWNPNTVAIVHTHANGTAPKPQDADIQIADRFGVPMFTLTIEGMYMYDPETKKTTRIHDRLDWLEPSKWARYSQTADSK